MNCWEVLRGVADVLVVCVRVSGGVAVGCCGWHVVVAVFWAIERFLGEYEWVHLL